MSKLHCYVSLKHTHAYAYTYTHKHIQFKYFKPKVARLFFVAMRFISLADMILDVRLLYKASASQQHPFLTVSLFISLVSPFLLQYSCGIKLFTLRRTFEKFSGFTSIFVILYLMPTGVVCNYCVIWQKLFDSIMYSVLFCIFGDIRYCILKLRRHCFDLLQ